MIKTQEEIREAKALLVLALQGVTMVPSVETAVRRQVDALEWVT